MSIASPAWPRSPTPRRARGPVTSGTRTFLLAATVMIAVTAASAGLTAWASRALAPAPEPPAGAMLVEPGRELAPASPGDAAAVSSLACE